MNRNTLLKIYLILYFEFIFEQLLIQGVSNSLTGNSAVNRNGQFSVLRDTTLHEKFELTRFGGSTRTMCVMNCMEKGECLSAAHSRKTDVCILYSMDYRMLLDNDMLLRNQVGMNLYSMSSESDLVCVNDKTKTASENEEQCELSGKQKIDSICSEWVSSPLIETTDTYSLRSWNIERKRNCTRPLNGGVPCSNTYENHTIELELAGNSAVSFDEARQLCQGKGMDVFHALYVFYFIEDSYYRDKISSFFQQISPMNRIWTDFKYSEEGYIDSGWQWVAPNGPFWATNEPDQRPTAKCTCIDVDGKLYDAKCDKSYGVVCQKPKLSNFIPCDESSYFSVY